MKNLILSGREIRLLIMIASLENDGNGFDIPVADFLIKNMEIADEEKVQLEIGVEEFDNVVSLITIRIRNKNLPKGDIEILEKLKTRLSS